MTKKMTTTAAAALPAGTCPKPPKQGKGRASAQQVTTARGSKTRDKRAMSKLSGGNSVGATSHLGLAGGEPCHVFNGEIPSWRQPRVRPEHQSMLAALRNDQNYIRDADGNVIPTGPTTSSATDPPQQPSPELQAEDLNTKAQAAAADDHERRQASNPYHLLPHLRPESPATHFPSSTATRDLNYHNEPTSTSNTSSTDGQPPRVEQQQGRTRVRFQLPANHREYPPKPARRKTILRKLASSTTVQLRIDGVLNNPVVLIDNRPAYMIPQPESSDAALHQTNEKDDVDVRREVRPQTPAEHRGHGKPLFFQPPALRKAADAAEGTGSGSSTDRPLRDRGDDPADHPPTPSDIEDLEDTNRAAERGEAPKWQVTTTDEEAQMQSTIRVGSNTQEVSWIWRATPSTLPLTFPLDPQTILSLRGSADGSVAEDVPGAIPLATGESFWLVWSKEGVWARKPKFPDDVSWEEHPSYHPPPRQDRQPHRNAEIPVDHMHHMYDYRARQYLRVLAQGPQSSVRPMTHGPSDTPGRPVASPGSESETSWPSEDNEDQDTNMLMQTHGGASSSKDPAPIPAEVN